MTQYVLGIDSSTQSCKALLVNAETGEVVDERRASHPVGTEVDPRAWVEALHDVTQDVLPKADAISIAGQQHGMVLLDENNEVVRDALLWNDTRSAGEAEELTAFLGGPQRAAEKVGSVPLAAYTATKLLWVRKNEPENAARAAKVALPHDYLTMQLNTDKKLYTDHGEASGTAYYNPTERQWDAPVASWAIGHKIQLPELAEPAQVIGKTESGALIAPGTGDNMGAALGLDLQDGDAVVSMGTSAVAMMLSDVPAADYKYNVSGFADATGKYLLLACTLNGAPVMDFACTTLGVDHDELAQMVLHAESGAKGAVFIPYITGERTPNLPEARAHLGNIGPGLERKDMARAMVEGLACSVREGLEKIVAQRGAEPDRILLIGGGAKSKAFREVLAQVLGIDIYVPEPAEFVALGAARQAAWALSGKQAPPTWGKAEMTKISAEKRPSIYRNYISYRNELYPQVA
ncbi:MULTISPECIES: xylulokinase [unclassified Rothia (in: high G+C Gram-positive bacteria)]|uniref:xylulokinase n=1 Tax=unclassified Rothia (in: high G+C Gram-positive bacteria) TaxID=2689056 RepID=UPI00195AC78B|nr:MULTISPECIES: xylulokinase [unclassified Rothia (in: high G+C Gram-positive bacteria)]MBM7051565.1 xylulokinase [Rothia sp. ZJ1223]QRZ61843.1 xylulokinase [Rothia sp. ZJ932]